MDHQTETDEHPHHRTTTDPAPEVADGSAATTEAFNRQASELTYHERVLATAADPDLPLLDRVRFCAFFSSLTDEFFRVRVAGLKDREASGDTPRSRAGQRPSEQIAQLQARFRGLVARQEALWHDELVPALSSEGVELVTFDDLDDDDRARLARFFEERVFPVLTPLAVGPAHPFPFISDLSLSIGVQLDPVDGGPGFARVKVPEAVGRLVQVDDPGAELGATPVRLVWIEEVIAAHLDRLFPGRTVVAWHRFRVTRNADYDVKDLEVDDLLETVATEIEERQFGRAVRLEVARDLPGEVRELLRRELGLADDEVVPRRDALDLASVDDLHDLDRPDLKLDLPGGATPRAFRDDHFARIRDGDLLVHHPYESFAASTLAFLEAAAVDPHVLAIKQTLYRTSGDSPVVRAIIRAAREGKQVVVLVELKARFDEAANIGWARHLEEAGVHVVYGFVALKTHTKIALVVREDEDGRIRRYGHIATGNYNPTTARFYEDLGVFTADPTLTADLGDLFNMLTGHSRDLRPERLAIAPTTLRPRLVDLIRGQAHADGRIVVKVNHLSHDEVLDALYEASRAGADIDLLVRTVCCLRPGIADQSASIRVRSIVGPVLEHSRIYRFGHEPEPGAYLLGSADLMPRNLDNRVEAVTPVDDPGLRDRLDEVLDHLLADTTWSWTLRPDGSWARVVADGADQRHDAQAELARLARERHAS